MAKKIPITTSISNTNVGVSASYAQDTNIITINNKNKDVVLKIESSGDIYYRVNDEMIKVNCSDDVGLAFTQVVLNITGSSCEDALVDNFLDRVSSGQISSDKIRILEKSIRKMKLQKLQM